MSEAEEARRYPRHPVAIRARLRQDSGELEAKTRTVSRGGISLRLPKPLEVGAKGECFLYLPAGEVVRAHAECKNVQGDDLCGFALTFNDEGEREKWDAFIAEEESTGSLWRMISRYATGAGDEQEAVRSVRAKGRLSALIQKLSFLGEPKAADKDVVLKLHTVGENGEAYRICFEKHKSRPGEDTDLVRRYKGFLELARGAITRVLDGAVMVRFDESQPLVPVRVCELSRGGFAYVHGGEGMPASLVSLCVGELILVEMDGKRVFPHFTEEDLERIACDTFRTDLPKPVFSSPAEPSSAGPGFRSRMAFDELPRTGEAPGFDDDSNVTRIAHVEGVELIRRAQAEAERVETRRYGEREIRLFPDVWARANDADGREVMGPTMQDGDRTLILALIGAGAPRVVKLRPDESVSLLGKPSIPRP